jgi:hypothetical protein
MIELQKMKATCWYLVNDMWLSYTNIIKKISTTRDDYYYNHDLRVVRI